jgi:hypothetical protein
MTLGPSKKPARLRPVRVLILAAALAVPGCAAPLDLDSGTGAALQEQVAAVRSALAGGDHAGALTTLDTLAANVERAAAEGKISPERKTRILQAITRVRSDALAAIPSEPAAPAPARTEAPGPAPSQQDGKEDEPKDERKKKDGETGKGKAEEEKATGKDKD